MLQAESQFADGRGFFRLDRVDVSAGSFTRQDRRFDALFGSCDNASSGGCNRNARQRDEGTALGVGWNNDRRPADLGTTPLGFEVTNWVSGLSWKTDVRELGGSVSWSHSKTDAQQRYPVNPGFALASNPSSASSTGGGVGYTLQVALEQRITPGWFIGASIDIQQAKDYTPSHGLIYLRYYSAGWGGDMAMPPQSLVPYADFK